MKLRGLHHLGQKDWDFFLSLCWSILHTDQGRKWPLFTLARVSTPSCTPARSEVATLPCMQKLHERPPPRSVPPCRAEGPIDPKLGSSPVQLLSGALEQRGSLVRRTLWKPLDSSWRVLWGEEVLGSQLTEQAHPPAPVPTEDSS